MLDNREFKCYCSKVSLDAVESFGQREQGLLIWECVQSSVLVRSFSIQETKGLSKAFLRHSKYLLLGQSMLSCAKLCDNKLKKLSKLLHSRKPCIFSQM